MSLILNKISTLFTREVLKFFCEVFENQFTQEITNLYTHFQGDISIFRKRSKSRQSIQDIIEDVFHLYLALPFKMGSSKGKGLSPKSKKIHQLAKALAHKTKGRILLEKLFREVSKSSEIKYEEIAELIFELVQNKALIPYY